MRTDMSKLIVAFRSFQNAHKNREDLIANWYVLVKLFMPKYRINCHRIACHEGEDKRRGITPPFL